LRGAGRFPVILASAADVVARHLVARWGDAELLTPEDLATPGWRYHSHGGEGTISIGGAIVTDAEIAGVVTRLPCVFPRELVSIVPEEREYVAAEMTAFLAAWLTELRCPVLNRPAATSLWGPYLHPEGWVHLASQLGIPVSPITTRAGCGAHAIVASPWPHMTVTVVGDRAVVGPDRLRAPPGVACDSSTDAAVDHALRLARAASVELLCARFGLSDGRYVFLGADYMPDVTHPEIASALRLRLQSPVP
jgi:hypothetical protein